VEASDLLIELLGENVDLVLVLARGTLLPELELSNDLVGERAGHDERGVASSATKVEETTLGKDDDTVTGGEDEAVNLGLDVDTLDAGVSKETSHVNLVIEVTDVTNDSVVLHLSHLINHDDVLVTSGGDDDINLRDDIIEGDNLETIHASLESADRVNLGDADASTSSLHGLSATLTDITETGNADVLTGEHDVGGTHDTIGERVTATVDVIELGLGDGVVNVDGREEELTLVGHLVETVNTGGGLLGNTEDGLGDLGPLSGVLLDGLTEELEDDLVLTISNRLGIREGTILGEGLLSLDTLVDEESDITTIIDDHVGGTLSIGPDDGLVSAPPVLLEGLTLPGEDSSSLGSNDGSSSVILGGEDVARAPTNLSTESSEGLDEDSGLDGHVEGTGDTGTLEGLGSTELSTAGHETGHLNLGELEILTTPLSKGHISDLVVGAEVVGEIVSGDNVSTSLRHDYMVKRWGK